MNFLLIFFGITFDECFVDFLGITFDDCFVGLFDIMFNNLLPFLGSGGGGCVLASSNTYMNLKQP